MTEIKESRYSEIKDKIINLDNISKIASFINQDFNCAQNKQHHTRISFSVTCFDNSCFESKDPSLFSQDSVICNKRVKTIEIDFWDYTVDSHISIDISQDEYVPSRIRIRGVDSNWVNGVHKQIDEIINSFTPQNTFVKKNKKLLNILFGLSIGVLYIHLLILLPFTPSNKPDPEWARLLKKLFELWPFTKYLLKYSIGLIPGIWPASMITDKLVTLWPSIEIQIGPEHTFIEKKRRKWLLNVFLIGVLPLIISIIADIITKKAF